MRRSTFAGGDFWQFWICHPNYSSWRDLFVPHAYVAVIRSIWTEKAEFENITVRYNGLFSWNRFIDGDCVSCRRNMWNLERPKHYKESVGGYEEPIFFEGVHVRVSENTENCGNYTMKRSDDPRSSQLSQTRWKVWKQ